jgi:hypothetical protein
MIDSLFVFTRVIMSNMRNAIQSYLLDLLANQSSQNFIIQHRDFLHLIPQLRVNEKTTRFPHQTLKTSKWL